MFGSRLSQRRVGHSPMRIIVLAALVAAPSAASAQALYPSTKIKVSVVHWAPMEGEYRAWDVLGGEFTVGRDGSVVLPVVGVVPTSGMKSEELTEEIANRLQAATGLMAKPEVSVSVLEYSPVYVLGAVTKPGEYKFTEGLDILRAVAMGGGLLKEDSGRSKERLNLATSLQQIEDQSILSQARIARLEAELDNRPTLTMPNEPTDSETEAIYKREQLIMSARKQELSRQVANMSELRELYGAEIGVFEQKLEATETAIGSVEQQLKSVTTLVERGVVVAARQADMERELAGLRSDRLDHVTAIMKARQNIADTTRNLDGLKDRQQTEVTTMLQTERAALRDAMLRRDAQQKLLLKSLSDDAGRLSENPEDVTYSISRMVGDKRTEMAAEPTTGMMPGDVLTIKPRDARKSANQIASSSPAVDQAAASR